ncbi:hypothetical protein FRACYDRAFT_234277 [Fragilariopsis cylindrus CCMP1102]|uniref:Uncharacterized protein n=1 Tax=Fragilariopsis cylindrus CCMP1102 TaxID=635003 RepID=A0A1E7FRA9_9STRA|nr:hypothetical protein FRACYDRAFT_234277 [Fragilariopsis cylindrus CCMP1102]|eukprot:OEU20645.1 hypothetical protein FRACYDRAFT_234277 [Fragilariopsis cylindrus CCMP1102]
MDLLGGYNSDSSDSNSDSNDKVIVKTTVSAAAAAITNNAIKKNATTTTTTTSAKNNNNNKINKADKKKRVIGKKLLKLSSVLPPHILNQLQQGGGGGGDDTEDSSDDDNSNDNNNDESDDDNKNKKNKLRKTTPKLAPKTTTRDYSKDSGLMGMLQELSKSKSINSSSSFNKNNKQSKILGGDDDSNPTEMDSQESKTKSTETKAASSSTSESSTKSTFSLGDAFVTATVETIKRKRTQQPTTTKVRNIHGNVGSSQETQKDLRKEKQQLKEDSSDRIISSSSTISAVPRVSSTPLYTNRLPRPSTSTIAPPPRGRGMATSSLRPAAPHSGLSSTTSSNYYNTYTPVTQSTSSSTSTASNNLGGGGGGGKGKKKQLSRKRQMEQMLRAGRLDEVQGDHELQGVAHIYNAPSEYGSSSGAAAATAVDSIRVVPTGAYDPATGTTSTSRDVTGTQKNKNQLNSLLANAAALENHRMQIGGTSNTANAYKATAKRKYGW